MSDSKANKAEARLPIRENFQPNIEKLFITAVSFIFVRFKGKQVAKQSFVYRLNRSNTRQNSFLFCLPRFYAHCLDQTRLQFFLYSLPAGKFLKKNAKKALYFKFSINWRL